MRRAMAKGRRRHGRTSLALLAVAALPRLAHPAKGDGSLSLLVVGDWGRKGTYNQSRVAVQVRNIRVTDLEHAARSLTILIR